MADAPDDLIAELAKLMAQDSKAATPAKPAAPVFTVRIPGEQAPVPRSSSHDATWIPQPAAPKPVLPPAPAVASSPEQPPARQAVPAPPRPNTPVESAPIPVQPVPRSFETTPRPETRVAPTPAASISRPVQPPSPSAAPVVAPPVVAPEYPEHDSIADLIAAELAIDPQPMMRPAAPMQRQEPPALDRPSSIVNRPAGENFARTPDHSPVTPPADLPPIVRSEPPRSEPSASAIPPMPNLGSPQGRFNEPVRAPEARAEPAMPRQATVDPSFARAVEPRRVPPASSPDTVDERIGQDPVDEIESMIGRAMRVNLDQPREPNVRESAAPILRPAARSLATPSLPKQAAPQPRSVSAADETILAAAQASGAQLDWADAPAPDKSSRKPKRAPREKRERPIRESRGGGLSRAVAGPLVALTLLLAAGFGLYWVLGMGGKADGPAPLLTADATPTKQLPEADPTAETSQQSVVFNEINGVQPGADEQLVSRDQADVNEVAQVATAPEVSQEGLANRRVRTLTVRPDGTIVRGDDSLAGSNILPVDRPEVPAVPGAETASDELLANVPAQAATPATTTPALATTTAVEPEPVAPVVPIVAPGATVPAVDTAGNAIAGRTTVIPLQRPTQFAQQASASAEPTTPVTQPEATPATTPSATIPGATEVEALGNTAPAYVQLASQRTEAEARTTAQALVTRYGPLFGGANMEVQRVDLGTRGVFYRVRVPAGSLSEASNICTNVKAAGGDCFTM